MPLLACGAIWGVLVAHKGYRTLSEENEGRRYNRVESMGMLFIGSIITLRILCDSNMGVLGFLLRTSVFCQC